VCYYYSIKYTGSLNTFGVKKILNVKNVSTKNITQIDFKGAIYLKENNCKMDLFICDESL